MKSVNKEPVERFLLQKFIMINAHKRRNVNPRKPIVIILINRVTLTLATDRL